MKMLSLLPLMFAVCASVACAAAQPGGVCANNGTMSKDVSAHPLVCSNGHWASLQDEVTAMRTETAYGQKVTLVDTKRIEAGKVLLCQQRVAGAYNDPKTHTVTVQISDTCQVAN